MALSTRYVLRLPLSDDQGKTLHTDSHVCVGNGETKTRSHRVHSYSSCLPHSQGLDRPMTHKHRFTCAVYLHTHDRDKHTSTSCTMQLVVIPAIHAPRSPCRPSFSGKRGSGEKRRGSVVFGSSVCMFVLRVGCCCPIRTSPESAYTAHSLKSCRLHVGR